MLRNNGTPGIVVKQQMPCKIRANGTITVNSMAYEKLGDRAGNRPAQIAEQAKPPPVEFSL